MQKSHKSFAQQKFIHHCHKMNERKEHKMYAFSNKIITILQMNANFIPYANFTGKDTNKMTDV